MHCQGKAHARLSGCPPLRETQQYWHPGCCHGDCEHAACAWGVIWPALNDFNNRPKLVSFRTFIKIQKNWETSPHKWPERLGKETVNKPPNLSGPQFSSQQNRNNYPYSTGLLWRSLEIVWKALESTNSSNTKYDVLIPMLISSLTSKR